MPARTVSMKSTYLSERVERTRRTKLDGNHVRFRQICERVERQPACLSCAYTEAGQSFGEVAIVTNDVRTASVVADETTELIVINVDLFNRTVRNSIRMVFENKFRFIATNPYFQKMAAKFRRQLTMATDVYRLPSDVLLTKQGDPVTAIYFIVA